MPDWFRHPLVHKSFRRCVCGTVAPGTPACAGACKAGVTANGMARVTGLEPATSGVTGRRSNQLSYTRLESVRRAN
jgi:hypothetical protein